MSGQSQQELDNICSRLAANDASLTELDLEYDGIGDEGAMKMAHALQSNNTLQKLDLESNRIGDAGAIALANALQSNNALQELNLGDNEIGVEGAIALAMALVSNKHTNLRALRLGRNNIGDNGATALAMALVSNNKLQQLDLWGNRIGDKGATALSMALERNATLQYLDLECNKIGDKGATALSMALERNTALEYLDLECNKIGFEMCQTLEKHQGRVDCSFDSMRQPITSTTPMSGTSASVPQASVETTFAPEQVTEDTVVETSDRLDTLASIADAQHMNNNGHPAPAWRESEKNNAPPAQDPSRSDPTSSNPASFSPSEKEFRYVSRDEITDKDVLFDRKDISANHPGTAYFRDRIIQSRSKYDTSTEKTEVIALIVGELSQRGRFIRRIGQGPYFLMTEEDARVVVSEALRNIQNLPPSSSSELPILTIPPKTIQVIDVGHEVEGHSISATNESRVVESNGSRQDGPVLSTDNNESVAASASPLARPIVSPRKRPRPDTKQGDGPDQKRHMMSHETITLADFCCDDNVTLEDFWNEFARGRNGGTPLRDLEEQGMEWRRDPPGSSRNKTFWNYRVPIYNLVTHYILEGSSETEALAETQATFDVVPKYGTGKPNLKKLSTIFNEKLKQLGGYKNRKYQRKKK